MKDLFKISATLYGKLIVATLMCFFIVISIAVITTALFTENIGYDVFGTKNDSAETQFLYTHYFADGEDTKLSDYKEQGYSVTTNNIKSKPDKKIKLAVDIFTQVIMIFLTSTFVYPTLWQRGTVDSNLSHFGHKKRDILLGFKCGLLAIAIPVVFTLIAYFTKINLTTALYAFLNSQYYVVFSAIFGDATRLYDLNLWQIIITLCIYLIVPIISGVSYILGIKNISILEKIMYRKRKTEN